MPQTIQQDDSLPNPHVTAETRTFYGFLRLLRSLPNDIANVGPLARDQALRSAAVAHFCGRIYTIAMAGAIGELLESKPLWGKRHDLGALLTLLAEVAQFVGVEAGGYRDSSWEPQCSG